MRFTNKTEAYLYSIYILENISKKFPVGSEEFAKIKRAIEEIRILVENHEQNPQAVSTTLENLLKALGAAIDHKDKMALASVAQNIIENKYEQTSQEKWENPIGRRFESQLQIELLQSPTNAMMASVKKISEKMLEILEKNQTMKGTRISLQDAFLETLPENAHAIAFGSEKAPTYEGVKHVLIENKSEDLAAIMHMHFKFAQSLTRCLSGEYKTVATNTSNISDKKMYYSAYYKERGRQEDGFNSQITTQQMGLLSRKDAVCAQGLPSHESTWVADAKAQAPNLQSLYLQSLIANDTPYVAGPSGMTSMFVGQMIGFDVMKTEAEKQSYMATVTAYMVSGGFHSLHEVLGPVSHCLPEQNLVPDYQASSVDEIQARTAKPPNFHAFYDNMSKIDPEFSKVREAGWDKLNTFFGDVYLNAKQLPSYELVSFRANKLVLNGISEYQNHKTGVLASVINMSGKNRAENYKKMMSGAESEFQQLIISYAVLATKSGLDLKNTVAKQLGFSSIEEARVAIERAIKIEIRAKLTDQSGLQPTSQEIFEKIKVLQTDVIGKIIKSADEKAAYNDSKGKLQEALASLKLIEDGLKPVELNEQVFFGQRKL
ncbi:MAG: hypothetical protein Q8L78_01825 [Coxiellaceae bacterium]|nr:hypothetical protein [Coxiellaceae bacterium]